MHYLKLFNSKFSIIVSFILILLFSINSYPLERKNKPRSRNNTFEGVNILYLNVRFDGETYHIVRAKIFDSTYTRVPIIKIYGIYGVHVITENNEKYFDHYTWMKPITRARLPLSHKMAYIEFVYRTGDEKVVIGRFNREEILSVATYPDRE